MKLCIPQFRYLMEAYKQDKRAVLFDPAIEKYPSEYDDFNRMLKRGAQLRFILTHSKYAVVRGQKVGTEDAGNIILNLPFPACYFELIDDQHFSFEDDAGRAIEFNSILVVEYTVGKYSFLLYPYNEGTLLFTTSETPMGTAIAAYMRGYLDNLNSKEHVVGKVGFSKFRAQGRAFKTSVNQIIYILPKSVKDQYKGPNNQKIDWSHQWEVRGHWRKCSSIGKDRDGQYVIQGFTWVKEYVKGPEDKDLIIKTRVFKQVNNETTNQTTKQ